MTQTPTLSLYEFGVWVDTTRSQVIAMRRYALVGTFLCLGWMATGCTVQGDDGRDSRPGCRLDTQCKGDRICGSNGRCQLPGGTDSPDAGGGDTEGSTGSDVGVAPDGSTTGGTGDAGDSTRTDGGGGGGDAGSADCDPAIDSDDDGLDNCEEQQWGTDPDEADTDGDGISDGGEVRGATETDPTSADSDGDGLDDEREIKETGTDPNLKDTDNDGLSDGKEVDDTETDPTNSDTDSDGLPDGKEIDNGSNPKVWDTDGDGLSDGEEVNTHGSDPTKKDSDGDGLSDDEEIQTHQTDPTKKDSDGDGVDDGAELDKNLDPTKADTDGDGLEDGAEINKHGTDPTKIDTDRDGLDDQAEIQAGSDPTKSDTDGDGLSDPEELRANTDPTKADTDGDGIQDREEIANQTDPTKRDTDGDGLTDDEERKVGLDPTKQSTYDDGTRDGNRKWVQTCLKAIGQSSPSSMGRAHSDKRGDWVLRLPKSFGTYDDVTFNSPKPPEALGRFDHASLDVHGFIFSTTQSSFPDRAQKLAASRLGSNYSETDVESPYQTHDKHTATRVRVDWSAKKKNKTDMAKLRNRTFIDLAPFGHKDVIGFPKTSGPKQTDADLELVVVDRGKRVVVIGVVTSDTQRQSKTDAVDEAFRHATDTGALAAHGTKRIRRCQVFGPFKTRTQLDLYWMLDQTGSMDDDNQRIVNFANSLTSQLQKLPIDARLGVSNMDKNNGGRLDENVGWHRKQNVFRSQVENRVINCQSQGGSTTGSWTCSAAREYGLESAKMGLRYMLGLGAGQPKTFESIRKKAHVVTILTSDERPNTFKDKLGGRNFSPGSAQYKNLVQQYASFFKQHTTMLGILTDGQSCGRNNAQLGYRDVALATGGDTTSLCSKSLQPFIRRNIVRIAAEQGHYQLQTAPISMSLEVRTPSNNVSRGRADGYWYYPTSSSLLLFGSAAPTLENKKKGRSGEPVVVVYDAYQ